MFTHILRRTYKDSSGNDITGSENVSADTELNFDGVVVGSGTNGGITQINWAATRANLRAVMLSCDIAVDVLTNDSGTPQDTIPLTAGQVLIWSLAKDGIGACPFSNNVTAIYVDNNAVGTGNFKVRALADQTP